MARAIWKGAITFGLVNIPVVLHSAEKKFDVQFNLVDSRDKARIRYVRVNEETGEEVPWEDVAKGYEYDENNYLVLSEEELKTIAGENSKTIDIEAFIEKGSLNCIDFEKPYYLVPDKKGEKGYVILRETLRNTKKIGIAKVIIHTRQYLAALIPFENALVLNLLRYDQELRKPSEFDLPSENLKTYKINAKEMEIAKQLVASMSAKWNPEDYEDEYRIALEQWIADKIHHEKPSAMKRKHGGAAGKKTNVINFVDLLKKSIAENKSHTPSRSHKSARKQAVHNRRKKHK